MKLTLHQGRKALAVHNDKARQRVQHPEKTWQNRTWQIYNNMSFEDAERRYYTEQFGDWLNERNDRARMARHPERVKTIDDILRTRQYKPEETILQIGDIDNHVDADTLWQAVKSYIGQVSWYYPNLKTLDIALHDDESTPHVHWRRVWEYTDERGNMAIGQEQSLKAMGVPLPYPDEPEGRYNNRKMTFTNHCRQIWIDVCRDMGLEIDTTPCGRTEHLSQIDYKVHKAQERLTKYEDACKRVREEYDRLNERLINLHDGEDLIYQLLADDEPLRDELIQALDRFCQRHEERYEELADTDTLEDRY